MDQYQVKSDERLGEGFFSPSRNSNKIKKIDALRGARASLLRWTSLKHCREGDFAPYVELKDGPTGKEKLEHAGSWRFVKKPSFRSAKIPGDEDTKAASRCYPINPIDTYISMDHFKSAFPISSRKEPKPDFGDANIFGTDYIQPDSKKKELLDSEGMASLQELEMIKSQQELVLRQIDQVLYYSDKLEDERIRLIDQLTLIQKSFDTNAPPSFTFSQI